MKELENLLTSLVQRGWKPWGKGVDKIVVCPKEEFADGRNLFIEVFFSNGFSTYRSFRELVSLESGLWQFVCINDLYKYSSEELVLNPSWRPDWLSSDWSFFCGDSEYRLLESALVSEEELAKLLVDNIIVEWKKE